ncbi:dihydroorotate dehydrogenase electron transfer subunit [Streptococcus moroccensis]|uniref:Dihydroorotate dehydrogenase B (NAD(+)), electron transfer subunit n=1 Tax=Streptococcus moroccensis TaxID=1451356 RepID=A0ABT9YNS0_9STRE|nr:dihydroorotate dehydrogenase electron transfer subunit [Streptococcus moroccensis]MDQ0221635.1 dihydroorotate dehydrogenase electron transfer subunit [Streptococcus moroccensis]
MILKEDMAIVSQVEIAPRIFRLVLEGQMVEEMAIGQFLHIRVPDPSKLLRRPISICEIDKDRRQVTLVYRIEGAGTDIISQLEPGSQLDCMGPQGNGFDISGLEPGQTALLIGGGIGVPPLIETAKQLAQKGVKVTAVLGFATQDAVILEDEMARYAEAVYVTTDDGSYGTKGYVSTIVDQLEVYPDAVYSCGAPGMIRYVDQTFENHPQAFLSLESRMACGMGACYACVVHPKGEDQTKSQRVCEEGPVFATGSLVL